ncbi:MAG: BadF/BadG/BcrA/BcrD ATPase family protein [Pseudomonadota bacterium]
MIEFLIGVDGGGTGTRVRLARADGSELAQGQGGPSGLAHGIANAWASIDAAVTEAFGAAGMVRPANGAVAVGAGLAGVHNKQWARQFALANPGFADLVVETDGTTTLLGAHSGRPGTIVAIGTGSVGEALLPDGSRREVGGWGFPAGDEASGGWLGLRAVNHIEQVIDGRRPSSPFARAIIDACGGGRDAIQVWLGQATQTSYARLAPIVIDFAPSDDTARGFLFDAGREVAGIAAALDPSATLPLALCGGLGEPLRAYLPPALLARSSAPEGDAASGALRMIASHLKGT